MMRFRAGRNDIQTNRIECVQASAMRAADGGIVLKLVNCAEAPRRVKIRGLAGEVLRTVFTGKDRDAHNSPFEPEALKETTEAFALDHGDALPPLSLVIYRARPGGSSVR